MSVTGFTKKLQQRLRDYPERIFEVERSYSNALKAMELLDAADADELQGKLREYSMALTLCLSKAERLQAEMLEDADYMRERMRQPMPPEEADFWQITSATLYVELGTLAQMTESCKMHAEFIRTARGAAEAATREAKEIQLARMTAQIREMAEKGWQKK